MDVGSLVLGIIVALLGAGGISSVAIFLDRHAKGRLANASATGAEVTNMERVIATLRSQVDRLLVRVEKLEDRVTVLEDENRGLRSRLERVLALVRRLWELICENDLEADSGLTEAVFEVLQDEPAG